ncbi:MAG: DNA mismatch repair endonuclease MutL [Chthoniobacterales bacterium]
MGSIRLLPEDVANQVAAGEVVERPASVIKELVENSLDAGAKRIEVLIRRGGNSQIKVVDDGSGMDRDDALLCLERHATSKIRLGSDLAAIATLGFRGEALPSIASVSRFRLSTRPRDAEEGTEILISGGKIEAVRSSGEAPGTQIEVRSLFYNLPARRKFLRTENTEASHIEHALHLQAIGHPGVAFTYLRDDRTVFQVPASATLTERLRDLYGSPFVEQLVEMPVIDDAGIRIWGLIGKPGISRSNRSQQISFVNGRAVENLSINHGLREGYHTALMRGQHPITFLFLEMDPAAVDVNVHPAKREVRFRDPGLVREILARAIRVTLESTRGSWQRQLSPISGIPSFTNAPTDAGNGIPSFTNAPTDAGNGIPSFTNAPTDTGNGIPSFANASTDAGNDIPSFTNASTDAGNDIPSFTNASTDTGNGIPSFANASTDAGTGSANLVTGIPVPQFKILGVLGKLYILLESADGLVLVDQHAAHERILFEQLQRSMETRGVASQRLLLPLTLGVAPRDHAWLSENLATLHRMGIGIEPFGDGVVDTTYKVDALPSFIKTSDPLTLIRRLIDDLRSATTQTSSLRLGEDVIAKTVCRHAVKANDVLHREEQVHLIQDLLACDLPYCCPHGRPTLIQFDYGDLEKKFGRKV